ncbi:hypothetical protein PENTCL1PPCAC_10021 [Pristionchus entomophagus]|uniref:Uncharacterized protein n=1 Tax=Pristionchus entomophagus TaxID=358040 RepID=A0AAV5T838_9BILA|nr:hypothetical protein PENTCL1PPCAC_10021 [Pristionchus entomophagus]
MIEIQVKAFLQFCRISAIISNQILSEWIRDQRSTFQDCLAMAKRRLKVPKREVALSERCLHVCPGEENECLDRCMLDESGLLPPGPFGAAGPRGRPGPSPRSGAKRREIVAITDEEIMEMSDFKICMYSCTFIQKCSKKRRCGKHDCGHDEKKVGSEET